jgi:DNA-binding NtrC family response regulator
MTTKPLVWIIDDDRSIRWVLEKALAKEDFDLMSFESADGVIEQLSTLNPDAIISDIRMPGIDGLALMEKIQALNLHKGIPEIPVIIMTAHSDLDSAVNSYQSGAFDYLPKPFDLDDAVTLIKRAIAHSQEQRAQNMASVPELTEENTEIIGKAPAMQEVFRAIGR